MNVVINYDLVRTPLNKTGSSFQSTSNNKTTNSLFHKPTQNNPNKEKPTRVEGTDVDAFLEKEGCSLEKPTLQCLKLIRLPAPPSKPSLEALNKLEFPVLSYTVPQLSILARQLFQSSAERSLIGKAFNLPRLIDLIAENYRVTAYHNFSHAFSVLLLLHQSYARSSALRKSLAEKQWFYVFMAALAHDISHPGTTNAFEIKRKSQWAVEAGNEAVLEKMHLGQFWNMLKKNSQVNFLQGYSSIDSNEIRKLITRMVLATDVAKHFRGLDALKLMGKQKKSIEGETALIAVEQLFHACDIGNPCLDFDSYMNWSALVSHEFHAITQQEQQLGLSVTGFLRFEGMKKFYAGQIGFCNGLVLPLWTELSALIPGLAEMKNNILRNMEELQRRKQLEE